MDQHTSLHKPVALPAVSMTNNFNINSYPTSFNDFIALAGSDISQSSQVYLLYEMSTDLLARRFVLNETRSLDKLKLLVSSCGCKFGSDQRIRFRIFFSLFF